jgi:hypothetical protein
VCRDDQLRHFDDIDTNISKIDLELSSSWLVSAKVNIYPSSDFHKPNAGFDMMSINELRVE